jgi:hypothetical protein
VGTTNAAKLPTTVQLTAAFFTWPRQRTCTICWSGCCNGLRNVIQEKLGASISDDIVILDYSILSMLISDFVILDYSCAFCCHLLCMVGTSLGQLVTTAVTFCHRPSHPCRTPCSIMEGTKGPFKLCGKHCHALRFDRPKLRPRRKSSAGKCSIVVFFSYSYCTC